MKVTIVRTYSYRDRWELGLQGLRIGGGFGHLLLTVCVAGHEFSLVVHFGVPWEFEMLDMREEAEG